MALVQTRPRNEAYSPEHEEILSREYTPKQVDFIRRVLSENELTAIEKTNGMGAKDFRVIAKVNTIMQDSDLREKFDRCNCIHGEKDDDEDFKDYNKGEIMWMGFAYNILRNTLGRDPTNSEFNNHLKEQNMGERFRIYWSLKNPHRTSW